MKTLPTPIQVWTTHREESHSSDLFTLGNLELRSGVGYHPSGRETFSMKAHLTTSSSEQVSVRASGFTLDGVPGAGAWVSIHVSTWEEKGGISEVGTFLDLADAEELYAQLGAAIAEAKGA